MADVLKCRKCGRNIGRNVYITAGFHRVCSEDCKIKLNKNIASGESKASLSGRVGAYLAIAVFLLLILSTIFGKKGKENLRQKTQNEEYSSSNDNLNTKSIDTQNSAINESSTSADIANKKDDIIAESVISSTEESSLETEVSDSSEEILVRNNTHIEDQPTEITSSESEEVNILKDNDKTKPYKVRQLLSQGVSVGEIAKLVGLTKQEVRDIKKGN